MEDDKRYEKVFIINNMNKSSSNDCSDDSDSKEIKADNQRDNTFKKDEENEAQNGESKNKKENKSDIIIKNDGKDNNTNEKNNLIKKIAAMKLDDSKCNNNNKNVNLENIIQNFNNIILLDEEEYEDDNLINKRNMKFNKYPDMKGKKYPDILNEFSKVEKKINNLSIEENIQKENNNINDKNYESQTISEKNNNNNLIDSKEAKRRKKRKRERRRRFKKRELKRYRKFMEKTGGKFTEESIKWAVINKGDELNKLWENYINCVKEIVNDINNLKAYRADASIIAAQKYYERCKKAKRKEMHLIDKYIIRGDRYKKRKEYLDNRRKARLAKKNGSVIVTTNDKPSYSEENPPRSKFTWTNINNQ